MSHPISGDICRPEVKICGLIVENTKGQAAQKDKLIEIGSFLLEGNK